MNINKFCPKRIKPKLLREQKTEALLVFIRTILEDSIEENDILQITSSKDASIIQNVLLNLLKELQRYVVNAKYLQYIKLKSNTKNAFMILAIKEAPLTFYYNSLSKEIVHSIPQGETWVPELLILALLSQWFLEEEKSLYIYQFLNDIQYTELLSLFDKARIEVKKIDIERYEIENAVIKNMYYIADKLVKKLNTITYRMNTTRISKVRKKRKK